MMIKRLFGLIFGKSRWQSARITMVTKEIIPPPFYKELISKKDRDNVRYITNMLKTLKRLELDRKD
jgi:hypothetical protein